MQTTENINASLNDIADEVLRQREKPANHYEIAAILESNGWSDKRAFDEFGFSNVFEMSISIWEAIKHKVVFSPFTPMKTINFREYPIAFLRNFFKGAVFAVPMAISVFAMLTIRFSLWSYESFNTAIATAIAIGTILSFLSIGGFTQAIARQGYSYIEQRYFDLAKRSTFFFVRLGYFLSISVVLIFALINLFLRIFPWNMFFVIIGYYFILNAIWLSVTIMYILDKELIFSGLLVLGIGIIFVLFKLLKIDIIIAQLISLSIVAVLGALVAFTIFRLQAERNETKGLQTRLPRKTIILNTVAPYFFYGFSYFAFLFVDRIVAWSTSDVYMPYVIWFRGEYELGLDFALLMLIIPMGFVEYIIRSLMESIAGTQKDYYIYEVDKMHKRYRSMYFKRLIIMIIVSILSGLLIHFLLTLIRDDYFSFIDIAISDTTYFVFIIALIGYAFTAMGLMNVELLFCVSQPSLANKCIIPGLITTVFLGFLLSRWIDYYYAVIGLAVGGLVFFALGTYQVLKILKKLDYYLYLAT